MYPVVNMNDHGCYYLTLHTAAQLDLFIKPVYKQLIVHSLNHFIDNKGLIVYGWALLSSSLHLVCQARAQKSLAGIRSDFKNFTGEKIIAAVQDEPAERRNYMLPILNQPDGKIKCWEKIAQPQPINMNDARYLAEKLEYIHYLPVKEYIVNYPEDYLYSSAADYDGAAGLVHITNLTVVAQALDNIRERKSSFKIYK